MCWMPGRVCVGGVHCYPKRVVCRLMLMRPHREERYSRTECRGGGTQGVLRAYSWGTRGTAEVLPYPVPVVLRGYPGRTRGIPSVVRPLKRCSGTAYFLRFTASHTARVLTPTLPQSVAPFSPPSRARAHGLLCRSLARASSRSTWCVPCEAVTGVLNWGTHCYSTCGLEVCCGVLPTRTRAAILAAVCVCPRYPRCCCVWLQPSSWALRGAHRIRKNGSKCSRRTRAVDAPMLQ